MTKLVSVIAREEQGVWGALTPQFPDLSTGGDTEAELLRSLPGTIAWCMEDDYPGEDFEIVVHVEREVGGVFIRVARDEQHAARQKVADRIVAALADPDLAERLRQAPAGQFDEVIYICALPTDTRAWLDNQLEERRGAVNVVVPLSDTVLWVQTFGDQPAGIPARPELPAKTGSPMRPATFGDVTATFADATQAPDQQRILVPA
jgi:predicted RNase H-like HicB family nuclease